MKVTYQLIEVATGKIVVSDATTAHVDYDIPGSQQRFSKQRAQVDAQDRAAKVDAPRPRRQGRRRGDPQPARFVFRRWYLTPEGCLLHRGRPDCGEYCEVAGAIAEAER